MFSIYKEYNIDYESFNKFKLTLNFNQIIFTIKNYLVMNILFKGQN